MTNFLTSSIGKKLLMGIAGLFLCTFLVLHLSINLMLLNNDGGLLYMVAVKFMTTNILIKIMEIVLLAGFLIHIFYGLYVQFQNWFSRPKRYKRTNNSQSSFFSKYMIHTGAIIGIFLVIHLMNFYFVKNGWTKAPNGIAVVENDHDFYHMVTNLFSSQLYCWMYIGFMIILGFHMNHAFQSAFQTLGINHPKYTPIIKAIGLIYSIAISVGFSIIPLYFLFFFNK